MSEILRQYGVATTILFPLLDYENPADFDTAATFAAGDTQISKDEGAFANTTNNPAHEGNGIYSLSITATEMQAARISITIIDQTASKVWADQAVLIITLENASAQFRYWKTDVRQIVGGSTAANNLQDDYDGTGYNKSNSTIGTATSLGTGAVNTAAIASGAVDADALADNAVNEIADGVWDEATSGHTSAGTFGQQCGTDIDAILVDTNELQTDLTNGGRLDLLIDAILADTNELQTDWTNGGRLDLLIDAILADTGTDGVVLADNAITAAKIATDAIDADAIAANAITSSEFADNTITAQKIADDAIGSGELATSAINEIADGVWDEYRSVHTTPGTFGETIGDLAGVLPDNTIADVDDVSGLNDPTAAGIADAVWDEARSGHTGAGTFGEGVLVESVNASGITASAFQANAIDEAAIAASAVGASELAISAVNHIADGIWDEVRSGHVTAGTFGETAASLHATLPDNTIADVDDITGLNNVSPSAVNDEVASALRAIGLDHLVSTSVAGTDVTDNSIIAHMVSKSATADWDSFVNTTDSLESLYDYQVTLSNKLGAFTGTGDNTILGFIRSLGRTDVTAPSDFGGSFDPSTDSLENLYDDITSILADTGTDGVVVASGTQQSIGDHLLKRDMSAVSGEANRSPLNALRFLRNKWEVAAASPADGTGTLTVYEEDDSSTAWTSTVQLESSPDGITESDPA